VQVKLQSTIAGGSILNCSALHHVFSLSLL